MEIENRETFLKVLSGEINLFLGAGFSLLARRTPTTPHSPTARSLQVNCAINSISPFPILTLPSCAQ